MKYKDVVNKENTNKVYLCKLKDGSLVEMQVHDNCESCITENFVLYNFENVDDDKEYLESDIDEIVELVDKDFYDDEDDYCSCKIDFKSLEKFKIQQDVYAYNNLEELRFIFKCLNSPIISGIGFTDEQEYIDSLIDESGIVFYWSEYDDFSCYGDGFTYYCKIITGVKVNEA